MGRVVVWTWALSPLQISLRLSRIAMEFEERDMWAGPTGIMCVRSRVDVDCRSGLRVDWSYAEMMMHAHLRPYGLLVPIFAERETFSLVCVVA